MEVEVAEGTATRPGCIYFLRDPRDNGVVYVGLDHNNGRRIREHLYQLRKKKHSNWRLRRLHKELTALGLELKGEIVETVLGFHLGDRERELIAYWRKQQGERLCNIAEGGEITVHAEETKERLAEKSKGLWSDPVYAARQRASMELEYARRRGMSVEEWRAAKADGTLDRLDCEKESTPEGRERHCRNMAIAEERKREREVFKTLTPLTCESKGKAFIPLQAGIWIVVNTWDVAAVCARKWYANHNSPTTWKIRDTVTKEGIRSVIGYRPHIIVPANTKPAKAGHVGRFTNTERRNDVYPHLVPPKAARASCGLADAKTFADKLGKLAGGGQR